MGKPVFSGDPVQQAMKLAQSPAGQQLIRLLQTNGGTELRAAMEQAAAGDYSQVQKTLSSLIQDPKAQQLFEQMGGKL